MTRLRKTSLHAPIAHRAWAPAAGRVRARHTRGFTLLEVLFSLVLLSFVMLGVFGALHGATRITHSADALMAQSESVRTVQQFLRRYLAEARLEPYVPEDAAPARMFAGDGNALQFVAPLPMQSGHAGLYVQTLRLRKNGQRTSLELAYRPYLGRASTREPVVHVLLENLAGGSFQYLASTAFGQVPTWHDDWQASNGMPLAVRIQLDPAWSTRVGFPTLVVPLQAGEGIDTRAGDGP